jgi:23S rRNA pseudoU1915 N3-methylase RlmH
MLKTNYVNQVIRNYLKENGKELLHFEILRIIEKNHNDNYKSTLTQQEKILAGLRYSEFFAEETTDQEYYNSELFAESLRNKYNIDYNDLIQKCKLIGLH